MSAPAGAGGAAMDSFLTRLPTMLLSITVFVGRAGRSILLLPVAAGCFFEASTLATVGEEIAVSVRYICADC